jgi:excisionase family DNA binding protein
LALPPAIDLSTAAQALGIGRTVAYQLVRENEWPTPVVRLGRLIRVPTSALLHLLAIKPD